MNYSFCFSILASIILLSGSAHAQAEVTLQDCINWSMTRNPSIRKIELEKSLDHPARQAAIGQFLPSVTAGYSISRSSFYNPSYLNPDGSVATYPKTESTYRTYYDSSGYLRVDTSSIRDIVIPIPEGTRKSSSTFIRLDETLFDGGKNYYTYRNALLLLNSRDARIADTRRLVRNGVIRTFTKAFSAHRQLELASKMTVQRRMQLEYSSARFKAGSVTNRDVLQSEVELGRAISDSLQAALVIRRALEDLNLQIGLPLDSTYSLAEFPSPVVPAYTLDDLENFALESRSDVSVLHNTLQQRKNDLKMEQGTYLPKLSTGLSHDRSERAGSGSSYTLNPRNKNTTIDLTLSWLLFDRFSRGLSVQQSKVELSKVEIELNDLEREIQRQVKSAAETLQSAYLQVQVAQSNARLAEQTLEFEQERYRLGSATSIDLNAAQLSYYQAQSDIIRLASAYLAAYGDLEAAVGRPLLGE